jgi:hypothetical protein
MPDGFHVRHTSPQIFLQKESAPHPFAICYNSQGGKLGPLRCMAGYSDYYSVIARAISGLAVKTDEARQAIYERARTALQERLRTLEPPISETDLAIERFALETAIERVETESRSSDTRHGLSFLSTINHNIALRGDSLKTAITAGLAQGLEFIQRAHLIATGRRITNIFGSRRLITRYPQIRIAVGLIVAGLVGIFVGIFLHWVTGSSDPIRLGF